ncbi:Bifunctional purine biosynthesis protein PurH [Buchnera aphidicola (Pterocallis alni)]|uniref:bifunctional phosphoribosylaminoimidazolecarboxamide formyltransferase/IMP cyclohydrolase n=1 Tax=Buchnera aphidicola TaxID=9 RepID=UPI0034643AF9
MTIKKKYIKNAIISVFNKKNIDILARGLLKNNIKIFSTTNTALELKNHDIQVNNISELTQYPEIMNGKIKTIHPKIFGGILGNKEKDIHTIQKYNMTLIDLVIVNFYPINTKNHANISNNIDIGGPAMVRAAAKNYKNTIVIVDYHDYQDVLNEININGYVSKKKKLKLAIKAFEYTTQYDISIIKYLNKKKYDQNDQNYIFPKKLYLTYTKQQNLKYGENPNQKAALYIPEQYNHNNNCFESIQQFNGKKLSYNNIYDAYIAYECVNQFNDPSCVIIKHGNPCGVSTSSNILNAYLYAYRTDPISAFGGIIGFNKLIDKITILQIIKNQFVEVIIGPQITQEALSIIQQNKKIKLLICKLYNKKYISNIEIKSINHSLLIQESNINNSNPKTWLVVSEKKPTQLEIQHALFAWNIVKFVKSNAIVYSNELNTISIGSGQTNRIESVKIANKKYFNNKKILNLKNKKITIASDAFFPFRDSIDEISYIKNISCIIQPGGSIRDNEVIQAANDYNLCMIFTNQRIFKH